MHDTDGVLDVDHNSDAGTGLLVEFSDLANMLEDMSTQMLLDQQQDDVALCLQRQAKKGLRCLEALATCISDDRTARRACLARRVHDGLSFRVFDKRQNEFEMHYDLPLITEN